MCGIVGIVKQSPVNQDIYDALTMIQHRGQDAAGIMTCDGGRVYLRKSNGLVRDAIQAQHMLNLCGNMGIGHVRYPTAGTASTAEAQPLYVNSPYGLAIAHNGNLINTEELTHDLLKNDLRHLNTNSDSEVLLNVFAHELHSIGTSSLTPEMLFSAVNKVHKRCRGAYAVVVMIAGYGILGFRDAYGIRPLVYGKRSMPNGSTEYMFASESVALDTLGFELVDDVKPGQAIFVDMQGNCYRQEYVENPHYTPCLFELVYLARPDSIMDKISVYHARLRMGEHLARKILNLKPKHDIDVVIPIPDTSRTSALSLAQLLNVDYREGFIKNRYIGRTFIMPGQKQRRKSVRQKLNAISSEFKDKVVLLVDDSIVRGTTSKEIVQMARDAGAKKVYFASAAPEVRFPNVYGIDMPAVEELVAHNHTVEQVAQTIGADWLVYQDLNDLYAAVREYNPNLNRFEDCVFSGDYVTGDINENYFKKLAAKRSDQHKEGKSSVISGHGEIVEVYNSG